MACSASRAGGGVSITKLIDFRAGAPRQTARCGQLCTLTDHLGEYFSKTYDFGSAAT
jgi:hypothetical protein